MKQLAIFASGSGTNAENIARLFHQGNKIRVAVVLCNRRQAGVYERMQALGVPVVYLPNSTWDSDPDRVIETLRPYAPDLLVLAGFMRAVRPEIIHAFDGQVINIHPSLLPKYGGKGMFGHHVHEAVIAAGEAKSGVTVHYVTEEIDGGAIVMQQEIDVLPSDTAETLEAKIHPVEYDLFPRAIVKVLSAQDEKRATPPPYGAPVPPALGGCKVPPAVAAVPVPPSPQPSACQVPAASCAAGGEAPSQTDSCKAAPKSQSADEAWAETLQIHNYSDEKAAEAAEHARQLQTPPAPAEGPAPIGPAPARLRNLSTDAATAQTAEIKCPKSYMWLSIVMAILFSTIPGIIAIIFSASVSSRMSAGDIKGAEKASRWAQWCIIISFVIGVLSATLWLPMTIMAG